jgi:putative ABC transport system ATP-binding protein
MIDQPAIVVEHLTKRVRDADGWLPILQDVQFTVPKGQSLAIIGASGSGKSTLLGLLAGLDTPTEGQVTLLGTPIFSVDEDARAKWRALHVGFVFQSFQLLAHLNALENVMLPLELGGNANARELAIARLNDVGLGERLKHYPRTLSGGEQQRVAIARAFATNPALLFADEPTGSLDSATGERVIELLFQMNRSSGSTLILVTHDQSLAARCERQIRIDASRLVSDSLGAIQTH